ncbi:TonB-dependent receptor [Ideonella sp. A 288]|uniref:TonB-dependent receptor n=1 Tax=Ideonella sp. A 288 TaxID=1962181 RepID=UPI000B4A6D57|nr:TonB-dependent receptor [Ideonella sp. A 288]
MTRPQRFALRPAALAVLQLALASGASMAQNAPQTVDVVGVGPVPGLDLPKDQVPSNVQTARAVDLERSHAVDLTAFIQRRLGSVHVNDVQNNPFQPDVNFRGFTASPLLGTAQGLSVYVDGVRLNQPFGDVVSWDLIPKSAIASIALMPGSNPLFGLNTLGGALSVQTKDGVKNPGSSVQLLGGNHGRVAVEFETGGGQAEGLNWFVTGNRFHEKGWRVDSPSDVGQLFGKFGLKAGDVRLSLTAALSDNDLNGNGLQEQRLLARDHASVYSKPDNTRNRSALLNLAASVPVGDTMSLSGNVYWRRVKTATFNGDVNDDSLDQAVYQPNADERDALAEAGYTGFPTAGESAANTPFPKWRCIANALLRDEPGEKCNGLINRSNTAQINQGLSVQLNGRTRQGGLSHQWVAGAALDSSRVAFTQGSELGYLNPDHSITGVGAFGDGVTGGDVDGEPYDTRVDLSARTRTWSVFASDTIALIPQAHLTLSGRYNRTTVKNRDAITPGGGPGSLDGDHTFRRFNPAIGLTFAVNSGLTAYAGFNQGSRAPSAVELGCADPENPCKLPNAMAGDPPLRQVVTTTLEAGVRGNGGGTSWNLGLFRADNKDDILFVADNAAGFGYFKNFGKTRRQGLEAGFSTRLGGATVGANYTWLDATFRSAELVGGEGNSSNEEAEDGFPGVEGNIEVEPGHRIPLVPRHMLKIFADLPLGSNFSIGADITAVGGSFARGNENNAHQPDGTYYLGAGRSGGYAVLNLSGDWRPTRSLTVFVQVNNVLDRKYHTAAQLGATAFDANGNFQARPFPANAEGERPLVGSTFYAPGAPRTWWVGARYAF